MPLLLALQVAPITANTAVSVALVVVIVGATWKISAVLSKICTQIEPLTKLPDKVSQLEGQVGRAVDHIQGLEEDVNILWGTVRGDGMETIRKRVRRGWDNPNAGRDS